MTKSETNSIAIIICATCRGLGLTAIMHAAAPARCRARALALAAFGAQAALVAGSPFYQLLVGRVLGYCEDNIRHHIRVRVTLMKDFYYCCYYLW